MSEEPKHDDPEVWTKAYQGLRTLLQYMRNEIPNLESTFPSMRAESDRTFAAMRDAGFSEGVSTILCMQGMVKMLNEGTGLHSWEDEVPGVVSLVAAALLLEVLDKPEVR